jgi:flagellin-like hook-associated protein FlgL
MGKLTITIGGIQNNATTKSVSITVDFEDPMWTSTSTAQDLLDYINAQLNATGNGPVPPPVHTYAGYSSASPVAIASLDSSGRLVITASERQFTVNVQERMSDKPMFLPGRSATSGVNYNRYVTITDDYGGTKSVSVAGEDYEDIDQFIAVNYDSFFNGGFILSKENGKLVITTRERGGQVTVDQISLSANGSDSSNHNWAEIFKRIGFENVPPANFIDGIDYPPQPEDDRSLWIQTGANSLQGLTIGIPAMDAQALGIMIYAGDIANNFWGKDSISYYGYGLGLNAYTATPNVPIAGSSYMGFSLNLTTHRQASGALSILDNALYIVTTERGGFGALTNRLEHTISSLMVSSENLSASESRIRDADMALEMMKLSKTEVLQQAATSMLSQANSKPDSVLSLLRF